MELYLRKVRLTAKGKSGSGIVINPGGISDAEIKISFSVTKDISSTPNDAEIKIWNLAEKNRKAIGKELDDIQLEVGYMNPKGESNVGIILKAQIRDVQHTREDNDIVTTLKLGEGDKAFRNATISKSYPKGTDVKTVVDDIQKQLEKEGITKGEIKLPEDTKPFKRPYAVCGSCKQELDTLGRGKNFYWSVQNGTFEVIPADGFIGGVVMLSPETGLVDTPAITDNGVKAKCLMIPEVRPNRRVQIKSQTLEMNSENGMYRVGQCTYAGDNREGDFTIAFDAELIKNGKVDQGTRKDKIK